MGICLIIKSGGGVDTSSATATADKILSGYTIYSNDNKVTGSMFNVGNQCKTDTTWGNSSGTYTFVPGTIGGVWGGYHDGTCVMQAATLASQTSADIPDASWCLTGYTYWKAGTQYTGTMASRGKKTWTLGANGSQTIESGWHDGTGTVSQSISVDDGEWGPTPTTTNQQLCWPGWYYSKNRWCWGNANLLAWNIKSGVSIFGVAGTYQGSVTWLIKDGVVNSSIGVWCVWAERPNDDSNSYGRYQWASTAVPSTTLDNAKWVRLSTWNREWEWYTLFAGILGSKLPYNGSSKTDFSITGSFGGDFWLTTKWRDIAYIGIISSARLRGDISPYDSSTYKNAGAFSISNGGIYSKGTWDGTGVAGDFGIIYEYSSSHTLWAKNFWVNSVK